MPEINEYAELAVVSLYSELTKGRWRTAPPERAFIDWYAQARYGDNAKCKITDGAKDGGIDAIIEEAGATVVVQSKYEPSKRLAAISQKDLAKFEKVRELIVNTDNESDFNEWLSTVRPELVAHYKLLRKIAHETPGRIRFDFVTTKRIGEFLGKGCERVDIDRIAPLWFLYEEGFTPPTEAVEIEFEDLWSKGSKRDDFVNFVGIANVQAFLKLMKDDVNERLFAQNVRTDLRTALNANIRETYEKDPSTFWMGNNGIYVICTAVEQEGNTLRLIYPSIINGSQTLHSIAQSATEHDCRILVRILKMDMRANRQLVSSIIKRTNSQNPMKPMNIAAHDHEQLNVARYFHGLFIFYERRQNEWKNEKKTLLTDYFHLTMKEVAQWSAVTQADIGLGTARARVKDLFSEPRYGQIFSRFGDDLGSSEYADLCTATLAALIVKRWITQLSAAKKGSARIAHLLFVRLVFHALAQSKGVRDQQERLVRDREFKHKNMEPVFQILNHVLSDVLAKQKAYMRSEPSVDLSNYFKRDTLTGPLASDIESVTFLRQLATALTSSFAGD